MCVIQAIGLAQSVPTLYPPDLGNYAAPKKLEQLEVAESDSFDSLRVQIAKIEQDLANIKQRLGMLDTESAVKNIRSELNSAASDLDRQIMQTTRSILEKPTKDAEEKTENTKEKKEPAPFIVSEAGDQYGFLAKDGKFYQIRTDGSVEKAPAHISGILGWKKKDGFYANPVKRYPYSPEMSYYPLELSRQ